MKRHGNLIGDVTDLNNILLAHKNASKGKQGYDDVKMVNADPIKYCTQIKEMLENRTYEVAEYRIKKKNDKGKIRTLYILPYFPDRIIQHALLQVLEPIWKSVLITDTFQSIKGRGIHKAKRRVEKKLIEHKPEYLLKMDVEKFYPSITNKVLKAVVRKKIKCEGVLWLLDLIICSLPELPIGNYISQYLGNLVLAYIDHKMKEVHKVKMYFRYCDDIVILGESKEDLHRMLRLMYYELKELALTVKGNYQVSVIEDRGIDFVGFVFKIGKTKLRKSIAKKLVKAKLEEEITSYFGWAKACKAKGLWYRHIKLKKEWKW